jgi:hypothetical protein
MLHENMNKQDDLQHKLDQMKLALDSRVGEVKDLQSEICQSKRAAEQAQERQKKSWEDERRAAQVQREQVLAAVRPDVQDARTAFFTANLFARGCTGRGEMASTCASECQASRRKPASDFGSESQDWVPPG